MCCAAACGWAAPKLLTMPMPCCRQRQHRAQHGVQQRLVAAERVGPAAQLRQRQGALGQAFENEESGSVRLASGAQALQAGGQAIDDRTGGVYPVTRESGGAAYEQGGSVHEKDGKLRHYQKHSCLRILQLRKQPISYIGSNAVVQAVAARAQLGQQGRSDFVQR